jgi:hypothetical protein
LASGTSHPVPNELMPPIRLAADRCA